MDGPDCFDLRPWAKQHRYRWRYEKSYYAEKAEYRGDGRWFVEALCRHGLIYPKGSNILLAYANPGDAKRCLVAMGIEHHQYDGNAEVFRFSVNRLDEVAAVLKPKRLPGRAEPTEQQRETLERHAFKGKQTALETTPGPKKGNG